MPKNQVFSYGNKKIRLIFGGQSAGCYRKNGYLTSAISDA